MLYLCDVRETNHIGNKADASDEELPPCPQQLWELIHQGCDEAFHRAELHGQQAHWQRWLRSH